MASRDLIFEGNRESRETVEENKLKMSKLMLHMNLNTSNWSSNRRSEY